MYRRASPWIAGFTASIFLFGSVHSAFLVPGIPQFSPMHGWDIVARRAKELRSELPEGSFYLGLGRKYFVASQLAFHLPAPFDVYGRTPLGERELQFDYWTDIKSLEGRDAAIIIEAGHEDPAALARAFRRVELVGHVTVPLRGGKPLRFHLYRGRGYVPVPLPPPPASKR